MKYRPWGPVGWALSLSSTKSWQFVGVIGTEERALSSWEQVQNAATIKQDIFVEMLDVDSEKYRERIQLALDARRNRYEQLGGNLLAVGKMELMAALFEINALATRVQEAGQSIVLDITSFPKRFFFPLLKALVVNSNVQNLVLTYTSPESYAPDNEPLYENIQPWHTLPGFAGSTQTDTQWIVSVGFLVESLRQYAGGAQEAKMKLLIPFPSSLSSLHRTWESVANLERDHKEGRFEKFRVEPLDMSAAFDRICQIAGNPARPVAFAPFGPKPTSAAMCLYALQKGSSVHYSQPTVYHPEYSRGIRNNDGSVAVSAYWVKHEGVNLYEI